MKINYEKQSFLQKLFRRKPFGQIEYQNPLNFNLGCCITIDDDKFLGNEYELIRVEERKQSNEIFTVYYFEETLPLPNEDRAFIRIISDVNQKLTIQWLEWEGKFTYELLDRWDFAVKDRKYISKNKDEYTRIDNRIFENKYSVDAVCINNEGSKFTDDELERYTVAQIDFSRKVGETEEFYFCELNSNNGWIWQWIGQNIAVDKIKIVPNIFNV